MIQLIEMDWIDTNGRKFIDILEWIGLIQFEWIGKVQYNGLD